MNRTPKDSSYSARSTPSASLLLRRPTPFTGVGRLPAVGDGLELDLFSSARDSGPPIGSNPGSDGLEELTKSVARSKIGRSGMDDLLDAELGKHDYDWLLTPPGTPQAAPALLVSSENQSFTAVPKRNSTARSSSTSRASRLSASQSENGHSARPARSSSVTRASVSSIYLSSNNRTSVLNTSTASVTSRPSTPSKRSVTPSTSRTLTPASHPIPSRSSTPIKTRSTYGSPSAKPEPLQNSRPATPSSRSQMPTNANSNSSSVISRSSSRPSTPTRQPIVRTTVSTATAGRSASVGRLPTSNGKVTPASLSRPSSPSTRPRAPVNLASSSRPSSPNPRPRVPVNSSSSRPSSPNPRPRAPVRPIDLPDFPNDVPPNLRTKLPERPLSAGRARPGIALTGQANLNSEAVVHTSLNRRVSLPVASRSKLTENAPKASTHSNGHYINSPENQKTMISKAGVRKTPKPASSTESTGFGRTISKKSLDMAIKHMDIRQSLGGIRGASIFPHSIRSTVPKSRTLRSPEAIVPVSNDESLSENGSYDGTVLGDFNGAGFSNINVGTKFPDRDSHTMKERNDLDLYGSYRYDAIFMKEDLKNTSWLLNVDDKSDQGSVFDHRFEPPPELFDPL